MPVLAVSIAIALFAVVTQLLTATSAISLSPTQQLTTWLVAAGLIVLLWIVYMAMQAQTRLGKALEETAAAVQAAEAARKAARDREERAAETKRAAEKQMAAAEKYDTGASTRSQAAEAESRDVWVPPDKLRRWRLNGPRQSVATSELFPKGCYLHSIVEAHDHDEETDTGGSEDTGRPRRRIYECAVFDPNPVLKARQHDAIVTVLTDQEPSAPPGVRHPLVEFDGLTITPYVSDPGSICMRYSLRATGIRFAADDLATAARLIPAPAGPVDVQSETSLRGHGNGNEPEP